MSKHPSDHQKEHTALENRLKELQESRQKTQDEKQGSMVGLVGGSTLGGGAGAFAGSMTYIARAKNNYANKVEPQYNKAKDVAAKFLSAALNERSFDDVYEELQDVLGEYHGTHKRVFKTTFHNVKELVKKYEKGMYTPDELWKECSGHVSVAIEPLFGKSKGFLLISGTALAGIGAALGIRHLLSERKRSKKLEPIDAEISKVEALLAERNNDPSTDLGRS